MSIRRQFFFSVALALAFGLAILGIIACWHARRSVDNEMRMALEASDRVVDNALLSLPRDGVDAYLERLVASFDDNRHVRVVLMVGDKVLAASHLAKPDPVPRWYRRMLQIPPDQRLDRSPRLDGRNLLIVTDPHNEIGEAWVQFRDGAAILALFGVVTLGLLYLVLARITAPLKKLGASLEAVGGGDYAATVPAGGPREIADLGAAFNRMTARLARLEDANHRLTGQMLAVQEEERLDLARDLHDEMGPFLFAMRLDAEAILVAARKSGLAVLTDRAHALGEAVGHIQAHLRAILKQLRPEGLAEVGLAVAIDNLATFWRRHHDGIALHLDMGAARNGFGVEADTAIYRLVQESLTNAVRHGKATEIWIAIDAGAKNIRVTVEDNGMGMCETGGGGMGLKGMRERLAALSGTLAVGAGRRGGARLCATIPRLAAVRAAVPAVT